MTDQDAAQATSSEISGIRAHGNFQAIDATFYNLTNTEGKGVAGLLVLLDRLHRPVRAELHFYEELEGFVHDNTVRQAQLLLQDRYYSREPITLRIMYAFQDRNTYDVPLPPPESASANASGGESRWMRIGAIIVAILLVLALVWTAFRLFGGGSADETAAEPTPDAESGAVDVVIVDEQEGATAADAQPDAFVSQDLPASQNARDDLAVGMRVIIQPGLQSNILSEPNLGIGESIGTIQDGEGAQLLDGPVLRKGESDTIVWWYALSDGGVEGWIPANTSQLTLLVPVESP